MAAGRHRRGVLMGEDEADLHLREAAVGEVDQELLLEHVDRAVDVRLGLCLRRLGDDELVDAAEDGEQSDDWDELLDHGMSASMRYGDDSVSVLLVCMRVRTISTRRFFARPSAVELVSIGIWLP